VELDADGELILHDEDRWVDLLVGAIHFFKRDAREMTDAKMASVFMRTCEGLIRCGAKVLAHPWRVFAWASGLRRRNCTAVRRPAGLDGHSGGDQLSRQLVGPAFFAKCVQRGAKIALGSDAHELFEVGSFGPHLDVLKQAAGSDDPRC